MAKGTRNTNQELAEITDNPNRLMRNLRAEPIASSMPEIGRSTVANVPRWTAESTDYKRLEYWLNDARRVAADRNGSKEEEEQEPNPSGYRPSVNEEEADIVLKRSELKTIIDLAVGNVVTLIDERIVAALQSCADNTCPSPVGAAVSTTIATIIGEPADQAAVTKMMTKGTTQAVVSPDIISSLANELVTSDGLMRPIAPFVTRKVEEESVRVGNVRIEEVKVRGASPTPPPSGPSDLDSLRSSRSSRRNRRQRRPRMRRSSMSPRNLERSSPSDESDRTKTSVRSEQTGTSIGSKNASSSRLREDDSSRLTIIKPVLDNFAKALVYRTHRLRKRSQHYDGHAASNVAKFIKRLRSELKETEFDETDRISILTFLKEFREAFDSIGIQERVSMWLLPHFMEKLASSSLSARLSARKSNSNGLHDKSLSSYVEVVNFLLATYATADVIAKAVRYLENFKQLPDMQPKDFAKRLYTKALRCGIMYEEKRVKSLFVEGLGEAVCDKVRLYWSRNPSEPLTQLARYADTVSKVADRRSASSSSTYRARRESPPRPSSRRNTPQSYAVVNEDATPPKLTSPIKRKNETEPANKFTKDNFCRICWANSHDITSCAYVADHDKLFKARDDSRNSWKDRRYRQKKYPRGRGGRSWNDRTRNDQRCPKEDEIATLDDVKPAYQQGKE